MTMSTTESLRRGVAAAASHRGGIGLCYLVNLALSLPLAAVVYRALRDDLGNSIAAQRLRDGFDTLWHRGFSASADGLAATFEPAVMGIGAVLGALDDMIRGALLGLHPAIVSAGVVYLVFWVSVSAGFFGHFAGSKHGLLGTAARLFPRFMGLTAAALLIDYALLRVVLVGLGTWADELTRNSIDERVVFAAAVARHAVVWLGVWLVAVWLDVAKAVSAWRPDLLLPDALRLIMRLFRRQLGRLVRLSLALFVVWLVLMAVYAAIAPGAGQSTPTAIAAAFMVGQIYVLARIGLRVVGYGAVTALVGDVLPARGGS